MKTIKEVSAWLLVLSQSLYAVPMQAVERLPSPAPADEPRATAFVSTPRVDEQPPAASAGTPAPVRANRHVPAVKPVPRAPVFSAWPTPDEVFRARVFEEPLVPVNGQPTPEDTRALASALRSYQQAGSGENVEALVGYLEGHPLSPWRPSLQTNMALAYLRTGYYSRALRSLEESWSVAQGAKDLRGKAVADRALGELVRLTARLGQLQRLEELLHIAEGRDVGGSAAEMVEQGKRGLWLMRNAPQRTLRCGPIGLDRILALARPGEPPNPAVEAFSASAHGTTLLQMRDLAQSAGLAFQMAKRVDQSAEIPTPALIHWAVGHFAAALQSEPRGLLIEDPSFGPARWVSRRVVHSEASGYALVREGELPKGWRPVDQREAETVWGMGPTPGDDPQRCSDCDKQSGGNSGGGCSGGMCRKGMAQYSFHTMLVSLHVSDTPVGYTPARGPSVQFSVGYHQREVFQPQIFTYFNLGPKWTSNWVSYVEDDPTVTGQPANVYLRGGGQETFTGFDPATRAYAYSVSTRTRLVKVSDDPVVYERRLPDGSVDVYGQPDGTLAFPRRVFLTRSVDAQANALSLTYDSSLRLVAITDALGQVSTLSYGLASDSLKITRVTDPFGRYASFDYDTAGRLSRITDVIGIQSSFEYGAADFVKSLTTPYGTTSFRTAEAGRLRWLEATDPLGGTERLEYVNDIGDALAGADSAAFPDGLANSEYPTGFHFVNAQYGTSYFWYRNTFFWSKRAHALAPGDYTAAKQTHWAHTDTMAQTSGVIENEREPLESMRTFYKYPGQRSLITQGTHPSPSGIGRVVEDGSSQIWQYEYNARGHKTKAIDPLGRETVYVYGTNNVPDANPTTGEGMDLLQVKRKNGANYDVTASYTYNGAHQPLTITDARGAATTYSYNAAGQVLTVTTPPAQGYSQGATTTFTYDTDGRLAQVSGPVPGANTSFTYDGYGRRRTSTDATGLTLTYDYDALDRVTRVTYPDTTYEETVYKRLDAEKRRDRLGRWTQTFYDALRRPLATRDAAGQTTQYQYGGSGCTSCAGGGDRLTKLIDPNGNATTWDYDRQGRVTQEARADTSSESYTYEVTSSRLKQKTDRKNVAMTFEYFLDGTLKRKSYSDTTPAVNYTYDPVAGQMLTAANGTDSLTWTYDNMDRVASEASTRNASSVGYTYDDAGNRAVLSLNGATHVTYGYDQWSRLTGITRGASTFAFAYDTPSRRTSMTYPNGVVTTYGYDAESRLTSLGASLGATPITSFSYILDAAGNRTRKTTLDWTEDYRYDEVYRLLSADRSAGTPSRWRFAYDPAGNRTGDQTDNAAVGATYNNVNELQARQPGGVISFRGATNEPATVTVAGKSAQTDGDNSFRAQAPVGAGATDVAVAAMDPAGNVRTNTYRVSASGAGATYTYDPNGNLSSKTEGTDTWVYTWNAENQLTKVEKNGAEVARFSYDPLGRRVEKVAAAIATAYVYDAWDILREVDGSHTYRYVHSGSTDEPLGRDESGALTYYHADGLGSVHKRTDQSGVVVHEYRFDAWGSVEAGSSEPGYSFTGREWDPQTALYYYRARYFSPGMGRFISEDPLSFDAGVHFYAYAENNPSNWVDPTGQYSQIACILSYTTAGAMAGSMAWAAYGAAGGLAFGGVGAAPGGGAGAAAGAAWGAAAGAAAGWAACPPDTPTYCAAEHTKGARPSTDKDRGGEKGDARRRPPRKRPPNWTGPWPPTPGTPWR
jgi:RHS repeat-associated protein